MSGQHGQTARRQVLRLEIAHMSLHGTIFFLGENQTLVLRVFQVEESIQTNDSVARVHHVPRLLIRTSTGVIAELESAEVLSWSRHRFIVEQDCRGISEILLPEERWVGDIDTANEGAAKYAQHEN